MSYLFFFKAYSKSCWEYNKDSLHFKSFKPFKALSYKPLAYLSLYPIPCPKDSWKENSIQKTTTAFLNIFNQGGFVKF